jgi:hypothetical protein
LSFSLVVIGLSYDFLLFYDLLKVHHQYWLVVGKLKFQITNQQITIQTKFTGLKIEDIPKQSMQQCAAKFAALDFPI